MSLLAEVKHETAPTTHGSQTVSYSAGHWGSNAPKLLFHLGTQNDATAISGHADFTFGFGNADEMGSFAFFNEDAQSSKSDTQYGIQTAYLASHLNDGAAISEAAAITGLAAAESTLDWSTVTGDGRTFGHLALGGDAIEEISIDVIETPLATGEVSYTAPGFQPDALIAIFGSTTANLPYRVVGSYIGLGFSDGTTDVSCYQTALNNQSTSGTRSLMRDELISIFAHHGGAQETATVSSLDETGYTLDWTYSLGGTAREVLILAIKGPAAKVIRGSQPTTDSTVSRDAGFAPKSALGLLSMKPESTASTDDSRLGVGFWAAESNGQASGGALDEDAQSVTNTDSFFSTYGLQNFDHSQTVVGQAEIGASGDDLTETWSSTNGTQFAHAWLVLGDAPVITPPGHSGRIDAGQVYQDGTVAGMTAQSSVSAGAVYQSKTIAGQIGRQA
jgi:hypothetical protein